MPARPPALDSSRPVEKTCARQAATYDRLRRKFNAAMLSATLEAAPRESFPYILDAACGPGLFIEAALRRRPDATAVRRDVTAEMPEQARQRVGERRRVRLIRALAERIPFPDGSFDLAVCANSFHHFRAPERALSEFRRSLPTQGCLVLTDRCDDDLACKICDWWLRLTDPSHSRTYGLDNCIALLRAAGFRTLRARKFKMTWLWGAMTGEAQPPGEPGAGSGRAPRGAPPETMN